MITINWCKWLFCFYFFFGILNVYSYRFMWIMIFTFWCSFVSSIYSYDCRLARRNYDSNEKSLNFTIWKRFAGSKRRLSRILIFTERKLGEKLTLSHFTPEKFCGVSVSACLTKFLHYPVYIQFPSKKSVFPIKCQKIVRLFHNSEKLSKNSIWSADFLTNKHLIQILCYKNSILSQKHQVEFEISFDNFVFVLL